MIKLNLLEFKSLFLFHELEWKPLGSAIRYTVTTNILWMHETFFKREIFWMNLAGIYIDLNVLVVYDKCPESPFWVEANNNVILILDI